MESILQLSESNNSNYPEYFKIFLDNCIKQYPKTFFASDYLFAAVYFIIMESGFCPIDMYETQPELCTSSFDIRRLRAITSYKHETVKKWHGRRNVYMVYKIPVKYGWYSCECEIHAVPSTENHKYLIVNLKNMETQFIKTACLNTKYYLKRNAPGDRYRYTYKNLPKLETFIKDELCNPIRETIMIEEDTGCCSHLLRLPEALQTKIVYYLRNRPVDIQHLSSTCTYFYNVTKNDSKLWQELCTGEFARKAINQVLLELFRRGNYDCSIFKQAFLTLKKRKDKEPKTCRVWYRSGP